MKRKLVLIDTETGGLNSEAHSILSIAVLVLHDGVIEDEFYSLINEGNGAIITEKSALKVNGLTMERVYEEGLSPIQTTNHIIAMLQKNDLRSDIRIAGHNVAFDIGFLKRLWRLAGRTDYSKWFSHRALCTQTGALLLEQAGSISLPAGSASLDTLVKLWNIKLTREGGHNALDDARATAEVLRREIMVIQG